jgi:uncharacterized membrane protein YhaH (DUF805 family)
MSKYYYSVGEDRVGPVTLGELKLVSGLSPETLVWYEGLSKWLRAGDVAELSELFAYVPSSSPPFVGGGVYAPSVPPNPFSFAGRISRLEYVISALMSPCAVMLSFIPERSGTWISLVLFIAFYTLLCWFNFGQGCKRCHDIGRSGWMQLIPLYSLYLLFAEGNKGANKYGPDPESV